MINGLVGKTLVAVNQLSMQITDFIHSTYVFMYSCVTTGHLSTCATSKLLSLHCEWCMYVTCESVFSVTMLCLSRLKEMHQFPSHLRTVRTYVRTFVQTLSHTYSCMRDCACDHVWEAAESVAKPDTYTYILHCDRHFIISCQKVEISFIAN